MPGQTRLDLLQTNAKIAKEITQNTVLDTARLRFLLGEHFSISSKNVHAYIMGEHGDSSFVPWSSSYIGCKPLIEVLKDKEEKEEILEQVHGQVRNKAYEIIARKKSTYYGIGIALTKILKAILNNEQEILTISALLNGEYGKQDIYVGVPAIVGRTGVQEILQIKLTKEEQEKFDHSCEILKQMEQSIISK